MASLHRKNRSAFSPLTAEQGHRSASLQAECHRRTRSAHTSETAEDYVEIISQLIESGGEARAADIARRLGITHVTVTRTISRLQRDGFVRTEPYRSIFLTEKGSELARRCREKHEIVYNFLRSLGISDPAAHADAEGIEHHVSDETLRAFEDFVRKQSADR